MTHLVVYGDFNCPFSRLASARLARLEGAGQVTADFQAVEHDPDIPAAGHPVDGELARELDQIRGMLAPGEPDPLRLPTRRVNTGPAVAAYAAASEAERPLLRERIFAAYWEEDRPIDDRHFLAGLAGESTDATRVGRWRQQWLAVSRHIVPVMVLPDGHVSRGVDVLQRLGGMER